MGIEDGIDEVKTRVQKDLVNLLDYVASGRPEKAREFVWTNFKEALMLGSFLWLYPFGWVYGRKNVSADAAVRRPVILVHGFGHNRSAFYPLIGRLRASGWKNIFTLNLLPVFGGVHGRAVRLKHFAEKVMRRTRTTSFDLIGHSLGGIVSRYYVTKLGGKKHVHALVTLGSPNQGTKISTFGVGQIPKELTPGNPLLEDLNKESTNGTRMVSIYSIHDWAIHPPRNARLPGLGRNVELKNLGHLGLLYASEVFEEIRRSLLEPTPE
ncbi:MAG: alpha/beta fold hydrolase [Nitrospirae bacterium]|nr:alpha/beta fold hydrolase [Nitrospirota bacterium]